MAAFLRVLVFQVGCKQGALTGRSRGTLRRQAGSAPLTSTLAVAMSNLSVLERLEKSLAAYERDEITRVGFVKFLASSIDALEGIPYGVRLDLRKHERDIETEGYFEEEGFASRSNLAKGALKSWLQELKEQYGHGNC